MVTIKLMNIKRPARQFLPTDFVVTTWEALEPWYKTLNDRTVNVQADLEKLLRDRSELEAVLEEDFAWRYIKMNCDTADAALVEHFTAFVECIQPQLSVWGDSLNNKIVQSEFFETLPDDPYLTYKRSLKTSVEIFRTENVPLFTELEKTAQQFGALNGAMTIEHEGKELTMQAAAQYLENPDREIRKTVFEKMVARRTQDETALNQILNKLVKLRHQVALNAGFENFRDYQFAALGRFDFTAEDCKAWHQAIAKHIVPLAKIIHQQRQSKLPIDTLKPWDLSVDTSGKPPLKPFTDGADLLAKTKTVFERLDPTFKSYLDTMEDLGHFDLESRKGKAPGGFNYPLYEIGAPFIFMNAVGTQRDLETMVHEGGHAIHSFLSHDYDLNEFKSTPSEVAELASMAMEMISMNHWDVFYENADDLARAQKQKIEDSIMTLPWVAIVDKFQHWLYENPDHSEAERNGAWVQINQEFSSNLVDYTGFENAYATAWQKQMHFFEVPFYYIEYGFAQMGSFSLWKNYTENPKVALKSYQDFMRLGYTKTVPQIYSAAGIKFDFSSDYTKTLAEFMRPQLNQPQ